MYVYRLVTLLEKHPTVIIIGETGCGKSTQIPQFIYEHELHSDMMIAITQPRRLAATSLAQRVAFEMDCKVGTTVGYSIRFDEKSSESTKIIFLTEGMLLREALSGKQYVPINWEGFYFIAFLKSISQSSNTKIQRT